jgi:hypothetical protein
MLKYLDFYTLGPKLEFILEGICTVPCCESEHGLLLVTEGSVKMLIKYANFCNQGIRDSRE